MKVLLILLLISVLTMGQEWQYTETYAMLFSANQIRLMLDINEVRSFETAEIWDGWETLNKDLMEMQPPHKDKIISTKQFRERLKTTKTLELQFRVYGEGKR